ncbi:hypothetical protein QR680_009921 [Steinernema hermaphroditum]|uniref:Uncharacterized protein n=1 Tax=Steinernema hermaphroditum TaxID=289476 RepID=A0AA39MAU0_9BILA|nr:hypothetical protein QR680_009921 [Steinernema hermaphroditum]
MLKMDLQRQFLAAGSKLINNFSQAVQDSFLCALLHVSVFVVLTAAEVICLCRGVHTSFFLYQFGLHNIIQDYYGSTTPMEFSLWKLPHDTVLPLKRGVRFDQLLPIDIMSALKVLFFGCLFATQAVALIPDSDQHELVLSVPSKDSEPISYGSLCNELSILPLIRVALDNYSDNLDMAARYIADHLQYKGYFLVHSQKLDCLRRSTSGCYFHDNRIYVLIVKYQ